MHNRPSYSAWRSRVTVALSNTRYLEGNVNDENFATKVRLNGQGGRGANGNGEEREREKEREKGLREDEKETVRDVERLGISLSATRLNTHDIHTSSNVLEGERPQPPPHPIAASHRGMQG